MSSIDWIVLIGCSLGIIYCWHTLPERLVLTREEFNKLPIDVPFTVVEITVEEHKSVA